jgi:beta-catenin-like protein 1
MNHCSRCGAFGVALPLSGGICGHCSRSSAVAPVAGQKRARDEGAGASGAGAGAGAGAGGGGGGGAGGGAGALSAQDIERILAESAEDAVPALDAPGVKRMLLAVERALTRNMAARAKHADEPLKYLDSEVELDRAVKSLHALAAAPEQYAVLAASSVLSSTLPSLLAHENVDIAVDVIELLKELTDDDVVGVSDEARAAGAALVDALAAAGVFADVLANLDRLNAAFLGGTGGAGIDAAADSNGVYAVLELVDAVLAVAPALALPFCAPPAAAPGAASPLLTTLFSRVRAKAFDEVKGLASEVLATLVVSDVDVVTRIAEGAFPVHGRPPIDGIEHLLEALAVYKSKAPQSSEDQEVVGNLFDVLCTCIVRARARRHLCAAPPALTRPPPKPPSPDAPCEPRALRRGRGL